MKELEILQRALYQLIGDKVTELQGLEELFSIREYGKNDFFIEQNTKPMYVGFVLEGAFREYYTDAEGREFNKAFCFAGDFTGSYYDLHKGHPSTATIQSLGPSKVLIASFFDYQEKVNNELDWLKIDHAIAHQLLMKKLEREYQLLALSAKERYDQLQNQYPELEQLVNAYHIASYLGITPVSFSRIRAQKS